MVISKKVFNKNLKIQEPPDSGFGGRIITKAMKVKEIASGYKLTLVRRIYK